METYSFFLHKIQMVILLSPAKIQNFKEWSMSATPTFPVYMKEAAYLIKLMRNLNPTEISELFEINNKLTLLNFDRYILWKLPFTPENAKPAALAYDGEVFRGLNFKSYTADEISYAQNHLILFSGLYGCLQPTDLIQPYRLEVSSKLKNKSGDDLYAYWNKKMTDFVNSKLQISSTRILINLSSGEYFKSLDKKRLKSSQIIDFDFLTFQNDKLKQIVVHTKRARGLMASYILKNKITDPELLKGFDSGGYWYYPELSTENKMVFVRS